MKALINNRIALSLIMLLWVSGQAFGQGGPGYRQVHQNKEKIKVHRIAFLTEKLDLTPEEAEKFWPLFNSHETMMDAERESFRKKFDYLAEDILALSDDEASEFLDARIKHDEKLQQMRKDFFLGLKEVLPPQKIIMLQEANHEFKLELMKRLREKPNMKPGPGGMNR